MKKFFLYGGLALLAIIIALFIFIGKYTDRVVDPYVRSLLEETKPMGHKIDYKKIRVNLFAGSIIIKEVRISPDTNLTRNKLQIELSVREIRLTGFSVRKLLFDKTLAIQDLIIKNPDVKLTLPVITEAVVQEVRKEKSQEKGSPLLQHISLQKIIFSGGSFQLIRNGVVLAKSNDIRLLAESISLDKNSKEEPIGYTYGEIKLNLSNIELRSETGLYDMDLKGFSITKSDSTIVLDGFSMIPKYDKKEFSRKLEFQNDRFDVKIGQIKIAGAGFARFIAGQPLEISSITVDSLYADIYRDKNVVFNLKRFPLFYNESFLKIPIPVKIDTVAVINSKIQYGELVAEHPVAGTIILDNFNLQSYNLSNQVKEDSINDVMHFFVQAKVMGEGNLKAELVLPLEGNLHDFTCSGSVGSMKLAPLNNMLEPSINMKFKGGSVTRMTFSFTANDNVSKGWMEFLYKDVDVVLVKKSPGKEYGFVSLVANWAALSNNPAPGKDVKIVEIGYERDKNKGIINYVWKTIQSGLVHTILPIKKYQINRKSAQKENDKAKSSKKTKK